MRPIDADAMLARLEEWNTSDSTDKALYNFTLHRILEQPTVDAIEVVRCEDCKHADEYYQCDYSAVWNSKNDYCGHGERKDG